MRGGVGGASREYAVSARGSAGRGPVKKELFGEGARRARARTCTWPTSASVCRGARPNDNANIDALGPWRGGGGGTAIV